MARRRSVEAQRMGRRRLAGVRCGFLLVAGALAGGCAVAPHTADLIVRDARILAGPDTRPSEPQDIAIRDGRIAAIGNNLPYAANNELAAKKRIVVAGFWNSHVHLDATSRAPDRQRALTRHWLQYGFVNVVDVGSTPAATASLLADIGAGRLRGPSIVRAGGSFVGPDGTPSYLPGMRLPELPNAAVATTATRSVLDSGVAGIKLFTGSFQTPTETTHMPAAVVAAVTAVARERGAFVVAHPTDAKGVALAVDNGVNILAHTAPAAGPWSDDLVARMVTRNIALAPTLYLFDWQLRANGLPQPVIERFVGAARTQLRVFHAAGGTVIFGTDAGFVTDYDPLPEYRSMSAAGLDPMAVLASLTTAPAQRFSRDSGRVEVGAPADLVLLDGDPLTDIAALAAVRATIRHGEVVFRR